MKELNNITDNNGGMFYLNKTYKINFEKVKTVEDVIKILKAMNLTFYENETLKDYLIEK